jgi:hyperosmotically inducible protein
MARNLQRLRRRKETTTMLKVKHVIGALVLAFSAGAACDDRNDDDRVEPDNTGVNERDTKEAAPPTAQSADLDKSDVEIMASIRKRVVDDGDLSTNAHNVKIIAEDGKVTLRGPVASAAERDTIARIAADVVGTKNVVNEIEVAP